MINKYRNDENEIQITINKSRNDGKRWDIGKQELKWLRGTELTTNKIETKKDKC